MLYKKILQNHLVIDESYEEEHIIHMNWESRRSFQEAEEIIHFSINIDHVWIRKIYYAQDKYVRWSYKDMY